jgi:hypothetical protein
MSSSQVRERIAALRSDAQALGELLAQEASRMAADELFEVTGELQGVLNAGEGAQLVAAAHAASHETRLTDRGPVQVHHDLGFVDAMAPSEVSLATGVGQWAAGRRVSLGAALAERFPLLLGKVLAGEVCTGTVQRVVTVCEGLDKAACAKIDAIMAGKLADLDPGRVAAFTRRAATRVAGDQLRQVHRRNARDRFVETRPGPDGATWWSALLPAATSAAAWSAITTLGAEYAAKDESLTADQARAQAFTDLLLRNVSISAKVMLGIPVITDTTPVTEGDAASAATGDTAPDAPAPAPATSDAQRPCEDVHDEHAPGVGGQGLGAAFRISTMFSGCEIPGIGFIDADTIEALLQTVPLQVGRALLDARTGTVLETTTTAYRPTQGITDFVSTRDGTCRMWGCDRPARACDLDHVTPWPAGTTSPANLGDLCRRHHRLKQRGRWTYVLHPDGTVIWTSPSGKQRTTHADHTIWPPQQPPTQPPPQDAEPTPAAGAPPADTWDPPPF